MFYGAYVLAKKGPLAKVWLAAHWDKKLTKAHVFETDVSATVEDIISPKVRMALRTSGHLLLGVVRIYSRKQKYLIHDLGEACAKIRMAFRPGIVDLPSEGGVANADAITLPEIFHDFENAVADLGSLDMEEQFTINRSRVSEITIAEDRGGGGGADPFSEFGEFGEEFGGGMEEIEKARKANTFEEEKDKTARDSLQLTADKSSTLLPDMTSRPAGDLAMDEQLPDRHDFGGGDFLEDFGGLGGLEGLGEVPSMVDITLGEGQKEKEIEEEEEGAEKLKEAVEEEEAMEVDKPPEEQATVEANQTAGADTTMIPVEEEGEFILEPVDVTLAVDITAKNKKRKRKLVVDTDKEFTSDMIRSQLENFSDILQQKLFPPPTKRAMLWKDMTTCEQLFQRPAFLFASPEVVSMVTRNYHTKFTSDSTNNESFIDLEQVPGVGGDGGVRGEGGEVEKVRGEDGEGVSIVGGGEDTTVALNLEAGADTTLPSELDRDFGMEDGVRPFDGEVEGVREGEVEGEGVTDEQASRVIPDMPDLEGIGSEESSSLQTNNEKLSAEMSEEFERQRWTKRTQQVLRILGRGFSENTEMPFSKLTQKCNRKQAASRFYTCLLLAKESTIEVQQSTAFGEILISKGPKFTEAF